MKTARFLRMVGPDGRGMRRAEASYPFAALPSPEVAIVALDSARFGEEPNDTPGADRHGTAPGLPRSWSGST